MKLTPIFTVACVAFSTLLLAAPAEAKDKHKHKDKDKHHKHHKDRDRDEARERYENGVRNGYYNVYPAAPVCPHPSYGRGYYDHSQPSYGRGYYDYRRY